jgi:hypothetical protein
LITLLFPDLEALYAVLTAYMDESATQHEEYPVIAVAGGIGTGLQWARLLEAWREVLASEDIDVFHTSKFETPGGRKGTVYENWPDPKLRDFNNALLSAIKTNKPELAFVACIPISEFAKVVSPFSSGRSLNERERYYVCAYLCLEQIAIWAGRLFGKSARITYYFETGGPHEGQMREAYDLIATSDYWSDLLRWWKKPTLAPKDSQPGLQIADKFVYEGAKHASHYLHSDPPEKYALTLPDGKHVWQTSYPTVELIESGLDVHTRLYEAKDIEKLFTEWRERDYS